MIAALTGHAGIVRASWSASACRPSCPATAEGPLDRMEVAAPAECPSDAPLRGPRVPGRDPGCDAEGSHDGPR